MVMAKFVVVVVVVVVFAMHADVVGFAADIKREIESFILSFVGQVAMIFKVYCLTLMANTK